MVRKTDAEPARDAPRYVDVKRPARLEPKPQTSPGARVGQWWGGVAHNWLSLRVPPVLPEIAVGDGTMTIVDRGELIARQRRAWVFGVLGGWAVCFAIMLWVNNVGLLAGTYRNTSLVVFFLCLGTPPAVWGLWFTRRGTGIVRNTLTIRTSDRTATIRWTRTDGDLEASGSLDGLALGLYPVELRDPHLPRSYASAGAMKLAALPMETYNRVDRGWIAIALLGDLWVSLGIDRTPEALRESLQPFRDAELKIDEDSTITVRGFGVRTLLRPDRARFSRKRPARTDGCEAARPGASSTTEPQGAPAGEPKEAPKEEPAARPRTAEERAAAIRARMMGKAKGRK